MYKLTVTTIDGTFVDKKTFKKAPNFKNINKIKTQMQLKHGSHLLFKLEEL